MKYDACIWDFNGTLLDDVMTGILSVNTLLRERSLPVIENVEHYRRVFRFPIIEYYRSLGFDFEREPYEELAPKWVALYLEHVKGASLYADAIRTLEKLKISGVSQTVLSATEENMLTHQLYDLGIYGYFDEVLGLDNIHAGSKLSLARYWKEKYPEKKALLVGDTDHDVETARTLGADCVLVCRGHQSREYLLTLGVPVANTLDEVCEKYF